MVEPPLVAVAVNVILLSVQTLVPGVAAILIAGVTGVQVAVNFTIQ